MDLLNIFRKKKLVDFVCTTQNCNSKQAEVINIAMIQCTKCYAYLCSKCYKVNHYGVDCDGNKIINDPSARITTCPQCQYVNVTKNGRVICPCGFEYCQYCRRSFKKNQDIHDCLMGRQDGIGGKILKGVVSLIRPNII